MRGTVSGGAKPLLSQKLTEAFSAISQGLTDQREQMQASGIGRSSAAFTGLSDATRRGFLEAGKIPTNYAQQIANQGVSASFGSVPTIMSGFEARNQLGLSNEMSGLQGLSTAASGVADVVNQFAQLRSNRYTPPEIPTPSIDLSE